MIFKSLSSLLFCFLLLGVFLCKKFLGRGTYLNYPDVSDLENFSSPTLIYYLPSILFGFAFIFLVLSLAGPQLPVEEVKTQKLALQIMLTLDLSGSMSYGKKMPVLKRTVRLFGERMRGHQLGITIYSSSAYLWLPPTNDLSLLNNFLDRVKISLLGHTTAIGEGILTSLYVLIKPLAIKDLSRNLVRDAAQGKISLSTYINSPLPFKGKIVVLFTDGQHNTGISPLPVASLAKQLGIRIYYLKVGGDKGSPQVIQAVKKTGGKFFHMENMNELEKAFREISTLERGKTIVRKHGKLIPMFHLFLLGGLIFLVLGFLVLKMKFLET